MRYLLIGGTGSFGKAAIKYIMDSTEDEVVVYSRDEYKQFEMSRVYSDSVKDSRIQYVIGDVRDYGRLNGVMAMDIDVVIHAAALKQVPTAEVNPTEAIATNITGTDNVVCAARNNSVSTVMLLSTDKAVEPVNLYGCTKAIAERLTIYAGYNVVRYGNVMGSRGSVIPYFEHCRDQGLAIPITHPDMTRFWITLDEAVAFVFDRLADGSPGEIYVPKLPSMRVLDLADAIAPTNPIITTGIRPGEKLHESLISGNEHNVYELDDYFIISPVGYGGVNDEHQFRCAYHNAYTSDTNPWKLSISDLQSRLGISQITKEN